MYDFFCEVFRLIQHINPKFEQNETYKQIFIFGYS